jgi:hypothetical protein
LFKIGGTPVTTAGLLQLALILFIAWGISYWLGWGEVRTPTGWASEDMLGFLRHPNLQRLATGRLFPGNGLKGLI